MEEEDTTLTAEPVVDEAEDFESIFSPKPRENPVYIDDLPDAIVMNDDGNPMLVVGKDNRIVMERWSDGRWLGTSIYTVRSVNQLSGLLSLHDDVKQQAAMTNFITAPRQGWRFKQTIPNLNIHKREAPRQQPTRAVQEPSKPVADGTPKHIGRPKGSKNRSAAEIAADNAVKAQEKRLKKEARLLKRAIRSGNTV
jgi:hypothetical protein